MHRAPNAAAPASYVWRFALYTGVIGGIVYGIAANLMLAINYGTAAVAPDKPFLAYFLALLGALIRPMLIIGVTAAPAWFALRRLAPLAQALVFGAGLGAVVPAVVATVGLMIQLVENPSYGFSLRALLEVIGYDIVSGYGILFFAGGTLGWLLARRRMRRHDARGKTAAQQRSDFA